MAATDMRKAGLEVGAIVEVLDPHDIKGSLSDAEWARLKGMRKCGPWLVARIDGSDLLLDRELRRESAQVEDVQRVYADAQQARQARFEKLLKHYPGDAGVPEESDTIERYCLVQKNEHYSGDGSHAFVFGDTFEDAVYLAGGEIFDDWWPEAVFDLDTGERVEVHVSSPVITRSEDQGAMVNVLSDEDLAKQAAYRQRVEQACENGWKATAKLARGSDRIEGALVKEVVRGEALYGIDTGDEGSPHLIDRSTLIVTDVRFRS